MTARVDVPRPVLEWAQKRSRRAPEAMRKRFRDWDRWLVGEARPTVNQAQDLAAFTHVPFGMLMLPEPPEEHLPIPDFRSGPEGHGEPSQELLQTVYLAQNRQTFPSRIRSLMPWAMAQRIDLRSETRAERGSTSSRRSRVSVGWCRCPPWWGTTRTGHSTETSSGGSRSIAIWLRTCS